MNDYLLDTNILILFFRKAPGYKELFESLSKDNDLYISAMTRIEVVRGMREHERKETFDMRNSLETVVITIEIADMAGELVRTWQTKGVILAEADTIIAATALNKGLALVTTNAKHFPMPDLVVYQADSQGKLTLRENS